MALSPATNPRGGFPLGLAGATAATRYVGAVASGAPLTGTFAVGDFVIGQDGTLRICTVAGSPGTWVEVSGTATPAAYVAAVLADSPLGFYQLDETTGLAQDSSGNAAHMTATAGTTKGYRVEGPMPGAFGIYMIGGASFSRAVLTTAVNNWTLEVWAKIVATGGDDTVLLNGVRASSGYSLDIIDATKHLRALYGGVAFQRTSTGAIVVNDWTHLAIVDRASALEYYVDGVLDSTGAETAAPNAPATKSQIGSDAAVSCALSMAAFYNTPLTAARIAAHFAAAV